VVYQWVEWIRDYITSKAEEHLWNVKTGNSCGIIGNLKRLVYRLILGE